MTFETQRLGKFIEAKAAASEILRAEGVKDRAVSFEEGLIMQAASHILASREGFYGLEVIRLVAADPWAIYPTLNRFEDTYRMTVSSFENVEYANKHNRRPRREYQATDFGQTVFRLFTPEK